MNHELQDQISLELARHVASRLRAFPELIAVAKDNLQRWAQLNAGAPTLLRCYGEWQQILLQPVEEICKLLCSNTEHAQRLRQNSPFAGVLSPQEVWAIKFQLRHAKTST